MNKNFKNSGLILGESEKGDVIIYNQSLKIETIIYRDFLVASIEDNRMSRILARRILAVVDQNNLARWDRVVKNANEIKRSGENGRLFILGLRPHIEARNFHSLRKIEKDIYFFREKNGMNEEVLI